MDFFASQEKARRKSTMLVLLFLVATVGIVATVYLLIFILLLLDAPTASQAWRDMRELADVLLWLGVIIVSIIGLGTLFKMAQLRRGGAAVAELLGGTPLAPDTRVPEEARVRNVVEEMAIASGLPVPPVYILEQEQGINAFAAGQSPGDAVIGLTSGCARQLNRAELQAVIGHEFSHILNGDMRLNIRLMSVIHGLIILGLAGRVLLHMAAFGGSSRDRKGSALPLLLGAGFLIVGSLGMFLGSLIKAAISRQREYLADASSVQFTRDASAMANALKKIGALSQGSRLEHRNAAQASHMFFAQGVTSYMNSLFATHPPLDERIRRVEPNWDGNYPVPGSAPDTPLAGQGATEPAHGGPTVTPTRPDQDQAETFGFSSLSSPVQAATDKTGPSAAAITASVGQLDELHVAYARRLKQRIPDELTQAAHDPLTPVLTIDWFIWGHKVDVPTSFDGRFIRIVRIVDRPLGGHPYRIIEINPLMDGLICNFLFLQCAAIRFSDLSIHIVDTIKCIMCREHTYIIVIFCKKTTGSKVNHVTTIWMDADNWA